MPTAESFAFPETDQMAPEMYAFEFGTDIDFGDATGNGSLAKENGYMELQTGDAGAPGGLNDPTYTPFGNYEQPCHPATPAADKHKHHLTSHRGSTSSSSSLRSSNSTSPHTSINATPMETSPSAWLEEVGDNEDTNMEPAIDFDQFLTLSSDPSSPDPPAPSEPLPEPEPLLLHLAEPLPDFHGSSATQPQGRAVKRRKAQPRQRTERSLKHSMNKTRTKGSTEFSPIPPQIKSNDSSPVSVYTNNLSSPDGGNNNFGEIFSAGRLPQGWPSASCPPISGSAYALPRADSSYMHAIRHGLSNSHPPAPLPHSPFPRLVIHPMPVKSRVETQIPLKITLHNLPKGIKRVHLPTHTISKPKLLQKPPTGPNPDMLELTTMLVCTSAMLDESRLKRAYGRAAAKTNSNKLSSPEGADDEENKPQNGGEVRICGGCITRERKRAGRKKHKKPEEEELWDRFERERAIVFNTQEVKEWQTVTPVMADPTGAGFISGALPEGTVQVDAPMRIACYCRHHGEKLGFQVIITLKNYIGNIVAQGISSSIMITDDHKTPTHGESSSVSASTPQSLPLPPPQPQSAPPSQHSPQSHPQSLVTNGPPTSQQGGIPQAMPPHANSVQSAGPQPLAYRSNNGDAPSLPFRQTHPTTDLQGTGQNFPLSIVPIPSHPSNSQGASTVQTPRNLSRQTSPASPLGVGNRKRKASSVSKLPTGLSMTKIEPSQSPNAQNDGNVVSAGNSPYLASNSHHPLNGDSPNQGQPHLLNNMQQSLGAGQSHNGAEAFMFNGMNHRVLNLERPVSQLFSAPVSAHVSRAPSPSQLRSEAPNLQHSQRTQEAHSGPVMPPAILRIIPNEGSKCGGAEITILGSNFTNDGLEVYFGSQRAITTTFWGPTSLVCMLPPSPVAGPVPVTINHPGRRHITQQPPCFTYRDDDEDLLIRTAFGILAGRYGRTVADPADFARSILYGQSSSSSSSGQGSHDNGNNNYNQFNLESGEAVESSLIRILEMLELDDGPNKAQINQKRTNGQTMLHLACSLGFSRFVTRLLSCGANLHIRDKGGFTALHMASMNNRPEIVHELLLEGADQNVKSRSGLTAMDVARSPPVRNILLHGKGHFRSRSVDLPASRPSSRSSAQSHWESSAGQALHRPEFQSGDGDDDTETDVTDSSSEEASTEDDEGWHDMRRTDFSGFRRQSSAGTRPENQADEGAAAPNATMAAIREQVATQLQQFHNTMALHLQNLAPFQMPNILQMPNLPPMPVLPGYQAYLQSAPVMQRISSLVPTIRSQRPESAGDHTANPSDNRWGVFPFFGKQDSPPAYDDIFPPRDLDTKQASAAQAAADFEADAKCSALYDQPSAESSQSQTRSQARSRTQSRTQSPEVPAVLQIGRKHHITKEQQEALQRAHAQRLKAVGSDKMLWFVWIPILVFVLGAMLWSGAPSFVSGTVSACRTLAGLITNPQDIGNRVQRMIQELA
ncbi:hypothetical protein GGR50DRAFT_311242 [Xylaria sp. CBS 124048]|nr:hypothetical protein GGR50DRAFT_311242 [Xylaria sp. CBS 124048]